LRSVPPLGARGAVTGAIAIGMAATSTLTTTIISIRTTISTVTSIARDKVIGSIIRNTVAMRLMVIGEQRTSLGLAIGSSQALVAQEVAPEREIGLVAVLERAE